jgi:peptide/nickel transport system permease protein
VASIQETLAPTTTAPSTVVESDVGEISQWRLMVRRFRKSKLAVASMIILAILYLCAIFATFLSPNEYDVLSAAQKNASPSSWTWKGGPAICGVTQTLDKATFSYKYQSNCNKAIPVHFFGEGYHYKLLGFIPTNRHLLTVDKPGRLLLWGADTQGRDVFARVMQGARVSLTVGLLGVAIATVLAAIIGTVSGYFGGTVDTLIQRICEVILSVPTLPLWATLAAVLPRDMGVTERYFLITLVLSLVGWASLARQVRGKVMAYSKADYVSAARAAGSSHKRIILTHLLPNAMSHIVAVAMLAIPFAIIAETSLSFLGIGMLPPAVSWGVLLTDAQQVSVVSQYPWMLIPAGMVVLAVTCFLLIGDGVRDAVDPYG